MTGPQQPSHEQWEELAAGYALHALEPDEELLFTDHLTGCARCQEVVAGNELIAAQLGSLAHEESSAAPTWNSLRTGILGDEPPAQVPSSAAPEPAGATVVDLDSRRRFRRHARLLGAAAAVVLALGAGIAVWQTSGSTATSPAARAISACNHQSGCSVVRLHTPDGKAPAVVLVSADTAKMVPLAMPAAPSGRQYVLWQLLRNGGPTAVATFDNASPNEVMPLAMPYADTAAFAVSVEPAGAPPLQPTTVIAVGNTTT